MTRSPRAPLSCRTWTALAAGSLAMAACATSPANPSPAAVSGSLRFLERPGADASMGPVVVMLDPVDADALHARPQQLFSITSNTDRFEPDFAAIAEGDYIVFVNGGGVSHRFFSADLGEEHRIPVGPGASSEPQRIDRGGTIRFFCSLHPDEAFSVLVTSAAFFDVVDPGGRYYLGPVPAGSYRLSIWSSRVQGPIRTVTVEPGATPEETIWLDPDLIDR